MNLLEFLGCLHWCLLSGAPALLLLDLPSVTDFLKCLLLLICALNLTGPHASAHPNPIPHLKVSRIF